MAFEAGEHWSRFSTRSLAFSDLRAFSKRLLSGESLVALLRGMAREPPEQKISRMSFTTGVAHHYISYDSASDIFFQNSQVCRKVSRLAMRERNKESLTIPSSFARSGKKFGGLSFISGCDPGEGRSGDSLSVRNAPHCFCSLPKVKALFDEVQISREALIGELLSHAYHVAQRTKTDLRQCLDDLACARRELPCMEARRNVGQVRVAALETRVQALESARICVPYRSRPEGYGAGYS